MEKVNLLELDDACYLKRRMTKLLEKKGKQKKKGERYFGQELLKHFLLKRSLDLKMH